MGNCVSSSRNSSTSTPPQHQRQPENAFDGIVPHAPTLRKIPPQHQRQPENAFDGSLLREMELGDSSTSTFGQDHRQPENAFYGIAAEASSSSSRVMKKGPWDVFINHRGCDVKHKLASTIYHTLDLLGLRVFLDVEELELGASIPTEIQEAMSTAALHIAIFSENYAQSPWCLAELSFMLKTGTTILPVFYHVKPQDLRWVAQGKGLYAPAFSEHQNKGRYSSNKLDEWKTALQRISYLSGYMLHSHNDDEGKLLKGIVNSVLGTMKKVPLEVAKHPVAMDAIVESFERSRGKSIQSEQRVQIVGIVGFGGSGKTTLATELYNRKSSSFNLSSFVHDVRDAASRNALHTKQKKLLEDFHINYKSFDNIREGKGILADRLKNLCGLIVLDDVDDEEQLDALMPRKESLGSGSVVIVTTREGDVLTKWGITSIYKMQPLQHFHAKQLFCWHAFLQPFPQQGFEDLVENCLDVCNGLPLSLKVIGGQLYGRRCKDYWVSQLDKIRRILPKEIKQRLKVSYDALDEDEQQIFLDIACFFIGEKRSSGIAVWDGSGWSGLHSWETLHNKCLVEVDEKECIRMHDHLRDLGREIATTHSPSRFWFQRQSMGIQRGMPIRGIMAATCFSEEDELPGCFPPLKEYMEMMRISNLRVGLQLLLVKGNDFPQEFADLSRGLLWLRWVRFGETHLPSWLSLENIRVLELLYPQNLKTLWEDAHPPLELRELLIEYIPSLCKGDWSDNKTDLYFQTFPRSIGHLRHLKKLSLSLPFPLTPVGPSSLPEEFCQLHSLEHLDLLNCYKLSTLPSRFGDLVKLQHISLNGCPNLEILPVSFKQLINLEYLDLSLCFKLTLESNILENITSLKYLNFECCYNLHVLPHHITNQASLGKLYLQDTSRLRELPASIGQLSKLETLIIGTRLLTSLPTSLGNLSSLATLILRGCHELETLPIEIRQLSNLQTLEITRCPIRELPFGRGPPSSLCNLRCIHLSFTHLSMVSISQECCPTLHQLQIDNEEYLMEIETLPAALKSISLTSCKMLKNIRGIHAVVNVQKLIITSCPELDEMPSLAGLVSLNELVVHCHKIKKIEGLEHLTSLEELSVQTRGVVPAIDSLGCTKLRTLKLLADNISIFEPCIQSMQIENWPREMTISARIFPGVWSIFDSFTFPGLTVVKSSQNSDEEDSDEKNSDEEESSWFERLSLTCLETNLSNAAIACFLVSGSCTSLCIEKGNATTIDLSLSEGVRAVICVFIEVSPLIKEGRQGRYLQLSLEGRFWGDDHSEYGTLITGERGSVLEGLKQLFQTFSKATSMSS